DLAPSWVPNVHRRLVYQSAGIARDAKGFPVGLGPYGLHQLDIDSGAITTLAESQAHDLLGPKVAGDGALYYLRRPWREPGQRPPTWRFLVDVVLIPFRLLWAVFQFFNFFSAKYTGKMLTAGRPEEGADLRQMMIWGNLIDADKAARAAARKDG